MSEGIKFYTDKPKSKLLVSITREGEKINSISVDIEAINSVTERLTAANALVDRLEKQAFSESNPYLSLNNIRQEIQQWRQHDKR